EASLIVLKVLDADGSGKTSDVVAGLEWCIRHAAVYNIRVINLSLGHRPEESFVNDPLCQAVEAAWNAGIVVVTAAGNNGRSRSDDPTSPPQYGSIDSPGNDPLIVTVGALNAHGTVEPDDDTVATYSSRGPSRLDHIVKPDLVAPGNRVVSLRA